MSCTCHNSEPINYELFCPVLSGDTMRSAPQIQIDDDDDTLASVTIDFRLDPDQSTASLSLTSGSGDIIINSSDALAWDFEVIPFEVSLAAGTYYFRVHCFNSDGDRRTPLCGEFLVL